MDNTYGAVVVGRNDGYGGNLLERFSYCINSLVATFDEVIYVDWNTIGNPPLLEAIYPNLIKTNNLKMIVVSPEEHKLFTKNDPLAQNCVEVLGRNIGLRRLSTDFLVSTNIDIICPLRKYLEPLTDPDTFYIGARRGILLEIVAHYGGYKDFSSLQSILDEAKLNYLQVGPSGAYPGERWSLVNCCGDFQLASRKLWYEIKGFEESLIYRGFADTNVQKKAKLAGKNLEVRYELPLFHIEHGGSFGGTSKGVNNVGKAIKNFTTTSNMDTWGFSEYPFKIVERKD